MDVGMSANCIGVSGKIYHAAFFLGHIVLKYQ